MRQGGTGSSGQPYLAGRCGWDSNYSLTPSQLECVVKFCDTTATTAPNISGKNFNLTWSGLVSLHNDLTWPCADDHRLEEDTDWKSEARSSVSVPCGSDGWFVFPPDWPQCSQTVFCADPGNSTGVVRQYISSSDPPLQYGSRRDISRPYNRLSELGGQLSLCHSEPARDALSWYFMT